MIIIIVIHCYYYYIDVGDLVSVFISTVKQFLVLRNYLSKQTIGNISFKEFSWERFSWAISVVMTRQNQIVGQDNRQQLCLIPVWDLCNHRHGSVSTFYVPEAKETHCHAEFDTEAGEEFFISYGSRSILEYLIYGGFIDATCNNNNSIKIGLPVTSSSIQSRPIRLFVPLCDPRNQEYLLKLSTTCGDVKRWIEIKFRLLKKIYESMEEKEPIGEQDNQVLLFIAWERSLIDAVLAELAECAFVESDGKINIVPI